MKIIYILLETFGSRIPKKFNDKAKEQNMEVEFWCVGKLFYDNFMYDETLNRGNEVKSVFVKNWLELIKLLWKSRENIYIFGTVGFGRRNYLIQLLIRMVKGKICWVVSGNGTGDMKKGGSFQREVYGII